jgi:ATP-binding cassette subfamily B protein/subfamily B ATP-binding cassette protein MsbA
MIPALEPWLRRYLLDIGGRYRVTGGLAVLAAVAAALFEGTTLAIFTLALGLLAGDVPAGGRAAALLAAMQAQVGTAGVFVLLVLAAVVCQMLRSGFTFASNALAGRVRMTLEGELRSRLFRQFMQMSFAQTARYKTGDLLSYVEQVLYTGGAVDALNRLVADVVLVTVYVCVLGWISWPMTLVALVMLALFAWPVRTAVRRVRGLSRTVLQANVKLQEDIADYLAGLRLIHTFAQEDAAARQVDAIVAESVRVRLRSYLWFLGITPAFELLAVAGLAVLLVITYFVGGLGTLPQLLVFVFVLYRLMPRITAINNSLGSLNIAWPFVVRVAEMLRTDDKAYLAAGDRPFTGLRNGIEFRNVTFQYAEADAPAVAALSFTVPAGRMTALVGVSGAGKSTLVNLLLRLYDPTSGAILADGLELGVYDIASWRRGLGVVEQDPFLFHDTVGANIAFGKPGATREEIEAAARLANAADFIARLPQGFATVVGDRGYRLSGGQRQRVAIARALIGQPDVLLLDEATSNLDSESEQAIQGALAGLRRERTVVVIAHRLSTVRQADRILVLDEGGLVEQGNHAELLAANGRYARLWAAQYAEVHDRTRDTSTTLSC